MHGNFFVYIAGPTGVGKSAFVDELAARLPYAVEVVNADMGQLYAPLSIGTAKPDLEQVSVPYHLFGILSNPVDYSVTDFRAAVASKIEEIVQRGALPIVVGGSSFYGASLWYPPVGTDSEAGDFQDCTTQELWDRLFAVDQARAEQIHQHDRYRIERALSLWYATGTKPSTYQPRFDPVCRSAVYYLTRDKDELEQRIATRTKAMVEQGWLDEVRSLSPEWREFVEDKKLIGYKEVSSFLAAQDAGVLADDADDALIKKIVQKTRSYAKRQGTFWRTFSKRLKESDPGRQHIAVVRECNLTLSPHDVYLDQIAQDLAAAQCCTPTKT